MTSPTTTMTDALNAFNTAMNNATATTNTSPPGAVQAGINYGALITAVADFGLLSADAFNVFLQDFDVAINDAFNAANLALSIVSVIEGVPRGGGL